MKASFSVLLCVIAAASVTALPMPTGQPLAGRDLLAERQFGAASSASDDSGRPRAWRREEAERLEARQFGAASSASDDSGRPRAWRREEVEKRQFGAASSASDDSGRPRAW